MAYSAEFEQFLERIEKYILHGTLGNKKFSLSLSDARFVIKIHKSIGGSISAASYLFNDDVSSIATILYGRKVEFFLSSRFVECVAPNGKPTPYSLVDFTEEDRLKFFDLLQRQMKGEFEKNCSLEVYYERMCTELGGSLVGAIDRPITYLTMSMVAFVTGREWWDFADRAAASRSEGFNETARRLKSILQDMSSADALESCSR